MTKVTKPAQILSPKTKVKIVGYRPHPGQRILHNWLDRYPEKFYWAIRTPRQWGKTTFLLNHVLKTAFQNPKSEIWYVTPFFKQTSYIFNKKLLPALGKPDSRVITSINRSNYEIRFSNGSYIQFQSAENYESLRSASITHLICDEFAFFRPAAFDTVLSPMLDVNGKQVVFASTPKGKNQFYDFDRRGTYGSQDYLHEWASFYGNIYQTGNQRQIQSVLRKKQHLPADIYRQEYEAEYIDGGGKVFRNLDRFFTLDKFAPLGERHYVGVDLASQHDRTVIVILNEHGQMVYMKRFEILEQNDGVKLSETLSNIINRFPNARGVIESNYNRAVLDLVRQNNRRITGFATTAQSKNEIINDLIFYIDAGLLAAPKIPELQHELENYESGMSPTRRHITYSAPEGEHDDCVMALAFAAKQWRIRENKKLILT